MTADREHDQAAELLGVYVLDAVEPDECVLVERHLASCPRCRAEVDGLREVSADLALLHGLDSAQPPAAVWDRIAAGIGAPATETTPAGPNLVTVDARTAARRRGPFRSRTAGRRAWRAGAMAVGAAALAALAVGLVRSQGQVHQLQSTLGGAGSQLAVHAALASPGHHVVDLRSAAGTQLAEVVLRRDGVGFVVASRMSRLPATETYQLWASINGRPISIGLLGRQPAAGAAFSLDTSAAATRKLMVTVEPSGGVPTPDRAPLAVASLPVT